ncbi:MAG TPA: GH116 family glycosyl-hydrolase [Actinomycetota bacterium]|nr:GH116 family glycosyl-hydrolase [Actinomycetota bacterium]
MLHLSGLTWATAALVFLETLAVVFTPFGIDGRAVAEGPPTAVLDGATDEDTTWRIPKAAWSRPIGDHPLGATGVQPPFPDGPEPAQSRTKRGIPVGGIGTGSFMYNLAGSFGPWEFDIGGDNSRGGDWRLEANRGHEERFLSQAPFHLYVKGEGPPSVTTLATEDVLPAWPRLPVGQGSYSALFPKAWFSYDGLPVQMKLKQFSPFIARNYRASSLPVGLFQFQITNPTEWPLDAAVMFTWPNAIYREDTSDYSYPRRGLRSTVTQDGATTGIRLQAQHPENVAETQRTEWVIATNPPVDGVASYTQDWAADGTGTDVITAFGDDGQLPDAPLDERRAGQAGAVAVKVMLPPGETRVIPFALAWDFPVVQFRNPINGTRWSKRYTQWYPGGYRGWDIAREGLTKANQWEQAIDNWWEPIARNPAYPLWLRRAALNELYYNVFGGVFWENGCLTKPKEFGRGPNRHLYFTHEANIYQVAESLDVRHYETRHLRTLFPNIERDVLVAWADFIMDDRLGRTPHDAGSPSHDPYFVYGQYYRTEPDQDPPEIDWKDLPSRFVQQAHAYWRYSGDDRFLRRVYSAAKRTMAHLATADADNDGLPETDGSETTYDGIDMRAESTLVAGLYIGALEAMADMAREARPEDVAGYQRRAARARRRAEESLWVRARGHYAFDSTAAGRLGLMTDALNGQRYAEVTGLRPVLRPERMARHLAQVYRRSVLPFGGGNIGAVNVVGPNGAPPDVKQGQEIWTGTSYFTAALMYRAGERTGRDWLKRAALSIARGIYRVTYEEERSAYWFDTPEGWRYDDITRFRAQQYQRPRAVWELLLEIDDPFPRPGHPQEATPIV